MPSRASHSSTAGRPPATLSPPNRLSRADDACDTENLAAMQLQIAAARQQCTDQVAQFQDRLAERVRHARILQRQAAADHALDDSLTRERGHRAAAGAATVAQNGQAVG